MILRNGDKTRLATTAEGQVGTYVCCLASLRIYLMYLRSVWLYPLVFDRIDGVLIQSTLGHNCWSIPHISLLYCMQLNGVLEETCWEESSASVAAMYPIDDFSYIIFLFYFPRPTRGPWCRFPPLVG